MNDHDEGGEFDSTMADPVHLLLARQAEMYKEGGHGLDKDLQKAGKNAVQKSSISGIMYLEDKM